jgi:hypothetical protein
MQGHATRLAVRTAGKPRDGRGREISQLSRPGAVHAGVVPLANDAAVLSRSARPVMHAAASK